MKIKRCGNSACCCFDESEHADSTNTIDPGIWVSRALPDVLAASGRQAYLVSVGAALPLCGLKSERRLRCISRFVDGALLVELHS